MKRYTITEKQLDELKKLLERLEETPREKADEENELIQCEGGEPIESLRDILSDALAGPLREMKFWAEDVERQEAAETDVPTEMKEEVLIMSSGESNGTPEETSTGAVITDAGFRHPRPGQGQNGADTNRERAD